MQSINCKVKISNCSISDKITISQELANEFGIIENESYELSFGNKQTKSFFITTSSSENTLVLPKRIAKKLLLPIGGNLYLQRSDSGIRLGPVIGILTTGYNYSMSRPFRKRSSIFQQFITAGQSETSFMYVFTPEMVDWSTKTIKGLYLSQEEDKLTWASSVFPMPDVIYERTPNRGSEHSEPIQSFLKECKKLPDIKIFNQGFFNKWSIHKILSKVTSTVSFVPESYLAPDIDVIDEMLTRHKCVFLKPINGSLGIGIFRVNRDDKNIYCRFNLNGYNQLHLFDGVERLKKEYFSSDLAHWKNYIVQQGITLCEYDGRPFDFRVHLNKDWQGKWQVMAIGTKVAGYGSVTTHIRNGGKVLPTDEVLISLFGPSASVIKQQIEHAALQTAEAVEQQIGPLGELGLDMGVDQEEKVWLFEVNSKPGRHIFAAPTLQQSGQRSAKAITDYSLYLSKFSYA